MKNKKITVISYSRTGNNSALADNIASKLSARHIKYTESKPKSDLNIALDRLFNRTPNIET
jgi:flavodoxin